MNRMIFDRVGRNVHDMPFPGGITYINLHGTDEVYPFLHDTALGEWHGRIICAWYNCTAGEIAGKTVIRGRWSEDGGKTWGKIETIAESSDPALHYVPVTFGSDGRHFYAFVTRMSGHDLPTGCEVFRYTGNGWESAGIKQDRVLMNTPVYSMPDGKYLAAGRMCTEGNPKPETPAVFLMEGKDILSDWKAVPLPGKLPRLRFPETAVIPDGKHVTAFVRGDTFEAGEDWRPWRFESTNGGIEWSDGEKTDLPDAGSKLFGGMTKNGLAYLAFNAENEYMEEAFGRRTLVLAVAQRGEDRAERCFRLLDGPSRETGLLPEWSYPCCMEHEGKLIISCTSAKSGVILMTVPIESLA